VRNKGERFVRTMGTRLSRRRERFRRHESVDQKAERLGGEVGGLLSGKDNLGTKVRKEGKKTPEKEPLDLSRGERETKGREKTNLLLGRKMERRIKRAAWLNGSPKTSLKEDDLHVVGE